MPTVKHFKELQQTNSYNRASINCVKTHQNYQKWLSIFNKSPRDHPGAWTPFQKGREDQSWGRGAAPVVLEDWRPGCEPITTPSVLPVSVESCHAFAAQRCYRVQTNHWPQSKIYCANATHYAFSRTARDSKGYQDFVQASEARYPKSCHNMRSSLFTSPLPI